MKQASSRFSGRASLSSCGETRARPGDRSRRRRPLPATKPPRGDPPGSVPPAVAGLVHWTGAHRTIPWAYDAATGSWGPEPPGRLAFDGAPPGNELARTLGKASPHPQGKAPPGKFAWVTPDKRPPGRGPPFLIGLVHWTGAHRAVPWATVRPLGAGGPEPPGRLALGGAPPGSMRTRRRGPPGPRSRSNSSLSAGRRRGLPSSPDRERRGKMPPENHNQNQGR